MPDLLPTLRDAFDIPREAAYLNCAYMSPQSRRVTEAGEKALLRKMHPWDVQPRHYFDGAEALREAVAALIGSDAEGVALAPAASYGLAVAAANVEVNEGDEILVLADQFPSNVYVWRALAAERGATVRTLPRPDTGGWTAALVGAITENTAVVSVPNVHWTDGTLVDLVAVGARVRAVGAALVVDASQSLGALPLDIQAVQPDFLVAVGYKWMMGPYGTAFLYAAPHRREGRPLEHSWLSRAGSEDFTRLVEYTDAFRSGARRYDVGQFGNFIHVPMCLAAVEQLQAWGIDRIQATITRLTEYIATEAATLGYTVPPASERCGHIVGLRMPGALPAGLTEKLAEERVHVSVRGTSIRVSPHVYNDTHDADQLLRVLAAYC